ncbi:hypothetical protein GWK47_004038 [Chionoecetes opilio]|uniref:Uncharacterized protein n=1 Tax=Chionoecetes opilio TaxID=41210 RepID=A0A8J4YFX3_CHIOP|nr:hypothetical protein GWK47_004038 [Chionoecetes opilio]
MLVPPGPPIGPLVATDPYVGPPFNPLHSAPARRGPGWGPRMAVVSCTLSTPPVCGAAVGPAGQTWSGFCESPKPPPGPQGVRGPLYRTSPVAGRMVGCLQDTPHPP